MCSYSLDLLINVLSEQNDSTDHSIRTLLNKCRNILIYGAGKGGRYTQLLLQTAHLPLTAFIDSNAHKDTWIGEVRVLNLMDPELANVVDPDALVIISIGDTKAYPQIHANLKALNIINIISYVDLFNEVFLRIDGKLKSEFETGGFLQYQGDILRAYQLFQDEESRILFLRFLIGHITSNRDAFCMPTEAAQYFPSDIDRELRYERIIDCGAGGGDFIRSLIQKQCNVQAIAMFEPDLMNYASLVNYLNQEERLNTSELLLWPCAVGNQNGVLPFFESGTAGSHISPNGTAKASCVKLAEVLRGFKATLIKMDIEGGELHALQGAAALIKSDKPDLAICVYHDVSHIWTLPLILSTYCPDYTFALRAHHYYGMATILYAYLK